MLSRSISLGVPEVGSPLSIPSDVILCVSFYRSSTYVVM